MDNNVLKALNVIEQVNNVILGKDKQIREIMAAFLAGKGKTGASGVGVV